MKTMTLVKHLLPWTWPVDCFPGQCSHVKCSVTFPFQSYHCRREHTAGIPCSRRKKLENLVFHVTLTNVHSYRCDSHCLARLFENLPAPPKHYGVFDVCRFAKFLPKRKTCGRSRQRPAMTDFHRKVNKFWQRFPKCDPPTEQVNYFGMICTSSL